jgi:hypothetical protein
MISDEQARAIWQRAAELQAEAERAGERQLPARAAESAGLTLAQVAQAAEAAGIDPDFVRLAVAEQQLPDADEIDPQRRSARWLRALLREPDAFELRRIIRAPPEQVLQALRTVALRPPYELVHEATVGADPVQDAVLVYRGTRNNSSFGQSLNYGDVRVLLFAIRAHPEGTQLHVRVPLYRRGVNLGGTSGFAAGAGWGGAMLGNMAVGMLPAAGALAAAPIILGGGAGVVLGVRLYKALYRSFFNGSKASVGQLLNAIELEITQ